MVFHQPHNSKGNYSYNGWIYNSVSYGLHFHRNYELIYVFSGKLELTINSNKYLLTPEDFALVLSNEVHGFVPSGRDCRFWVGVFSADYVALFDKNVKNKVSDERVFRCSRTTVSYLKEYLLCEKTPCVMQLKSCLYAVCNEYMNSVTLTEKQGKQFDFINETVDYIASRYTDNITLKTLSEHIGYDYAYMSRIFKKTFGMSFNEYLNMYRFNQAIIMLEDTDYSLGDIAVKSGFQSIRSFNNTFCKTAGVSPGSYRKLTAQ